MMLIYWGQSIVRKEWYGIYSTYSKHHMGACYIHHIYDYGIRTNMDAVSRICHCDEFAHLRWHIIIFHKIYGRWWLWIKISGMLKNIPLIFYLFLWSVLSFFFVYIRFSCNKEKWFLLHKKIWASQRHNTGGITIELLCLGWKRKPGRRTYVQ